MGGLYAGVEEGVNRDIYTIGLREGVKREGGSEKEGMQGWGRDVCRGRGGRYARVTSLSRKK